MIITLGARVRTPDETPPNEADHGKIAAINEDGTVRVYWFVAQCFYDEDPDDLVLQEVE